ncbi:MAG: phosphatase PAP2 family protein [candidate division Zixibacteria bacterium HGW-Zixibacteria-1]|nr:MAG: phosphatase PAP2 family protein [candidate division Zixibacteria bacterium HGW-Zixibacteria-1]
MLDLICWLGSIDRAVFFFINTTIANPVTDFFMPLVTIDLHLKIFYGLCLGVILWKGDKRLRLAIIASLIVVTITDQLSSAVLKPLFERPRPCWNMEVHLLVGCGSGFSMPSSHAANLFGQAYLFREIARPTTKYLIPLAIVVALSRVFVGVHYPADILVGAALGTLSGWAVGHGFNFIYEKKIAAKKDWGGDINGDQNRSS